EGHRTAFVDGIRVSYPRRWSLLQLSGTRNPAPLLQLGNFEPHGAATVGCGPSAPRVPASGVLLVVAQDRGTNGLHRWPVRMEPRGSGCFETRWRVRGVAMEASMIVGARARLFVRQDMLEAFHSMRFPSELRPGLATQGGTGSRVGPMFVVTSGYLAGRPSSYLAHAHSGGVCLNNVVGSGPATGRCDPIRMEGPIEVLGTGPWAVVTGVVARRAASVHAVLPTGETVLGEVITAPPFLRAPFNFFSIELPVQSSGVVTALDAAGNTLGRRPFDAPPLPVVATGGVPGKRWVLLDREQSNGVRCIDLDKGHGDVATFCPAAVPVSRDVQATLMPISSERQIVVG